MLVRGPFREIGKGLSGVLDRFFHRDVYCAARHVCPPARRTTTTKSFVQGRHLLHLWLLAHEFASIEDRIRAGVPNRDR